MIRVALLGMGEIARLHVDALAQVDGLQIGWVCDTDPTRRRLWADRLGCDACPTAQDLYASAADLIVVLLPHHLHAAAAIEALRAGKHVLVEKPMATTPDDCQDMIDAARQQERLLFVADTAEFIPGVAETGRRYRAGDLGRFLTGASVVVREYFTPHRPAWFLDPTHSGGGMFANVGVHRLAMTRTAVPDLWPVDVLACVQRLPGRTVEACTTAMVRYADHAAMQYQEIGHVPPAPWVRNGTHMFFEGGMAGWDDRHWFLQPTVGQPIALPLPPAEGYRPVYERLRQALQGGDIAELALGAAQDVAIVTAAYRSAETGRCIPVTPFDRGADGRICAVDEIPAS